jgi:hypothetical protein
MNLEALPDSYIGPFPINYTDKFEAIDYSKMKLSSFLYQSNVKAKCWKDEHEWRLIFYANKALKVPCFDMPGSRNRVFYYDSKVVEKIILGFSFFDQCEFDTMRSTRDTFYVKLKNDRKLKQRLLKYILSRKIPVSIINSKNGTTSELVDRPVEIEKESNRKYKIKYVG